MSHARPESSDRRELDDLTLARAKRGDRPALDALIRHHERSVYAVVGRMLVGRSRACVDDVAQDAFIKVLRAIDRFDPAGPASLSTWILTVATRTCIDHLRRSERVLPLDDLDEQMQSAAEPTTEHPAEQMHQRARVERAMLDLAPEYRAVLILRAYHDLDYPEIADALGIAEGTVKSRLSRARAALRRAIGGFDD